MKQLTFLDLCAGIGGFRLGLEAAGHRCIGYCEYDKFAVASYKAMHETEGEWFASDVTKLKSEDVPRADIWTFGFPCQDVSVAGKQRGLSGKRSGIYFNIIDLIKGKKESDKPTYLLVENVKNLLSVHAGFDFATVLSEMDKAGYDCRWQVLNSKDFGVPQNRERVFITANLRSRGRREILSLEGKNGAALKQVIRGMQGYRVYDPHGAATTLMGNAGGVGAKTGLYLVGFNRKEGIKGRLETAHTIAASDYRGINRNQTMNAVYEEGKKRQLFIDQSNTKSQITDTARCLTARYTAGMVNRMAMNSAVLEVYPVLTPQRLEKRQNGRRIKDNGEPMFTLTGQDRHGILLYKSVTKEGEPVLKIKNIIRQEYQGKKEAVIKQGRIRRLTPKECFRLQGFPDSLFEKAQAVNSDAQLYKQAGNAVTTTVAYAVAMTLPESRK
ncbi:DNA cytosine methyltransferase [Anaeromicropila populeti]|uniref:DNA (cytosine-5-)-methyltransferase n=1 Tax=Anaeromicropila populeti TaxID=37658 RepID=A0A1I6LQW4_9FIRM|nr:DNA (cytosine-5-)-methyltransferase [Anaeromicropila populeti]SFS05851.1 DNA (cytosine-5)-methyltransferase 1 [Anaeromicropila populeti]